MNNPIAILSPIENVRKRDSITIAVEKYKFVNTEQWMTLSKAFPYINLEQVDLVLEGFFEKENSFSVCGTIYISLLKNKKLNDIETVPVYIDGHFEVNSDSITAIIETWNIHLPEDIINIA